MSAFIGYISYLGPIIAIVVTVVTVGRMLKSRSENRSLQKTGIPASAEILDLQRGGLTAKFGGQRHLQVVMRVKVHPPGRPPYEARLKTLISELQIPQAQPGATVQVRIDPFNPTKIALESDNPLQYPGMSMNAKLALGLAAFVGLSTAAVTLINETGVGISEPDMDTTCGRAMACCQEIAKGMSAAQACGNINRIGVAEETCQQLLNTYQDVAKRQGLVCD